MLFFRKQINCEKEERKKKAPSTCRLDHFRAKKMRVFNQ